MHFFRIFTPVLVGIILYSLPIPEGLNPQGWALFAIFMATILGIVLNSLPMGPVALIGLGIACFTHTLDLAKQGLNGFGSPVVWLVVFVFFIARSFIKTHLGSRIAYFFVELLGKSTLGMGYGIILSELIIAPVIPSNSARAGGIMFPILKSISEALGSRHDDGTARKLGSYLTQIVYHTNLITSAMFLTAMAANPMIQSIAASFNITITWTNWFIAALVPGLFSLALLPLLLFVIYPPEIKVMPHACEIAKEKLREMGPLTSQEWIMVIVFAIMLFFWVFGEPMGISTTETALLGLLLLLLTKVLTWDDILKEKDAWNTLIWFSILITMSKFLQEFGLVDWFSQNIVDFVKGMEWHTAFFSLILIYFYSHYFFASNTAHIGAMYGAFLGVAILVGAPALLSALVLGFMSSLFSSMTHYGSSSAVVLYGAGYVSTGSWWGVGLVVSVFNLVIWLSVGSLWWKYLGLW